MDFSRQYPEGFVRRAYLLLFILSGFSGLIYESIWTHYLKLFLGHAAYAQTLVLAIFMGGMAVGAWFASRWTLRWSQPLLAYAATEAVIGLLALVFHPVFIALTGWSYDSVIPALGSPLAAELWKWALAALLILPQSVLLGATFPFMSAGLLRRVHSDPGRRIAGLYFANSLGAAVGVLVAGFVLVARIGLPGTIMTAGFINLALALVVYVLVRSDRHPGLPARRAQPQAATGLALPVRALLLVSLLTGMASFIYEIGWIRMLALVLGSSTHAFELMISAFITGLAIGGFWIRRRVDHFAQPLQALALIQLVMGVLAIGTLVAYGQTFHAMEFALRALKENDAGYVFFNLASHGLALLVMLPATICAGMTLPIITHLLLTRGEGETAIGRVYAVNTVGAIAGVALSVQWLMPLLGLKGLIIVGGLVDIGIGLWLLWLDRDAARQRRWAAAVLSLGYVALVAALVPLDLGKMASGVYRAGSLLGAHETVLYHHDGRTATVDVVRHASSMSIRTNGKADAAIYFDDGRASPDESTMTLLAAIPLMVNPAIAEAAVIGMGSGMSTHTLLLHPAIQRVDTVEIEPGMVEGARLFGSKVERAFTDPRSEIHIADAKTFFTNQQRSYDLILSEPSNPWVSGVAGLFSVEFYRLVSRHLNEGGVFAQWFHLYEIDMPLVASVARAMAAVFPHYRLYGTGRGDVLFLASLQEIPPARLQAVGEGPLRAALARIGVASQADADWAVIGNAAYLQPLFDSYGVPANSDYFPFLDQNAVRTRYLNAQAIGVQWLPAQALADIDPQWVRPAADVHARHPLPVGQAAAQAMQLRHYWRSLQYGEALPERGEWQAPRIALVQSVRQPLHDCDLLAARGSWLPAVVELANTVQPYWAADELAAVWQALLDSPCLAHWPADYRDWLQLLQAAARRDDAAVLAVGARLLPGEDSLSDTPEHRLLLRELLVAHIRRGDFAAALQAWSRYERRFDPPLHLRALSAYALARQLQQQ